MKPKPSQYELDMIAMRERIAANHASHEIATIQAKQASLDESLDQIAKYLEHSADMLDNLYNIVDIINKRIARYERRHDGIGEA